MPISFYKQWKNSIINSISIIFSVWGTLLHNTIHSNYWFELSFDTLICVHDELFRKGAQILSHNWQISLSQNNEINVNFVYSFLSLPWVMHPSKVTLLLKADCSSTEGCYPITGYLSANHQASWTVCCLPSLPLVERAMWK